MVGRGRPRKDDSQKTSGHYVNNKVFLEMIIDYQTNPNPKLYNEIGKIVLLIVRKYISKAKFASYSQDRQNEMISNACLIMITSCIKNFDAEKFDNPFAWMTTACHNSFLQHINHAKKMESRVSNLGFIQQLEDVSDG